MGVSGGHRRIRARIVIPIIPVIVVVVVVVIVFAIATVVAEAGTTMAVIRRRFMGAGLPLAHFCQHGNNSKEQVFCLPGFFRGGDTARHQNVLDCRAFQSGTAGNFKKAPAIFFGALTVTFGDIQRD